MIITILGVVKRNIGIVLFVLGIIAILLRTAGGFSGNVETEEHRITTVNSKNSAVTPAVNSTDHSSSAPVIRSFHSDLRPVNDNNDSPVPDLKAEMRIMQDDLAKSGDSLAGSDYDEIYAEFEAADVDQENDFEVGDEVYGGYQEFDANWAVDEEYRYISMFSESESLSMFSLRSSSCREGECSVVVSADREGREGDIAQALANELIGEKGSFGITLPHAGGQEMEIIVSDNDSETIN